MVIRCAKHKILKIFVWIKPYISKELTKLPTITSTMKFTIICLALIGAASAGFSTEGQAAIVKAHNDLRSAIAKGDYVAKGTHQPAASDMLKMVCGNDDTDRFPRVMIFRVRMTPLLSLLKDSRRTAQTITQRMSTERISTGGGLRKKLEIWTLMESRLQNLGRRSSKTMDG